MLARGLQKPAVGGCAHTWQIGVRVRLRARGSLEQSAAGGEGDGQA